MHGLNRSIAKVEFTLLWIHWRHHYSSPQQIVRHFLFAIGSWFDGIFHLIALLVLYYFFIFALSSFPLPFTHACLIGTSHLRLDNLNLGLETHAQLSQFSVELGRLMVGHAEDHSELITLTI